MRKIKQMRHKLSNKCHITKARQTLETLAEKHYIELDNSVSSRKHKLFNKNN